MSSSYFCQGDVLVASAHAVAQGFEPGARYVVRELVVQELGLFGRFVTYYLVPEGSGPDVPLARAVNAPLLFSLAAKSGEVAS